MFCVCMLLFIFVVVAAPSFFDTEQSTVSSSVFTSDLGVNEESDQEWDSVKQIPSSNSPEVETKVTVHINQSHPNRKKSLASMKSIASSKESYPALPPLSEESESENDVLMNNTSFQDRITFQPLPSKRYAPPTICVENASLRNSSDSGGIDLELEELEPLNPSLESNAQSITYETSTASAGTMTPSSTQTSLSIPSFLSNVFTRSSQSNDSTQDVKEEIIELNDVNREKTKNPETVIEITDLNKDIQNFSANYANGGELIGDAIENTNDTTTENQPKANTECAVM